MMLSGKCIIFYNAALSIKMSSIDIGIGDFICCVGGENVWQIGLPSTSECQLMNSVFRLLLLQSLVTDLKIAPKLLEFASTTVVSESKMVMLLHIQKEVLNFSSFQRFSKKMFG